VDCPAGRFGNSTGLTACYPCLKGTFSASAASLTCVQCGTGRFSGSDGLSYCDVCPVCSLLTMTTSGVCISSLYFFLYHTGWIIRQQYRAISLLRMSSRLRADRSGTDLL